MIKLVQSFLGFKQKKSVILEQRNSILKLLITLNIPSIIIMILFQKYVPNVYMDQYFHYNQFLQYYNGNYHIWDSKITTPPGLYHIQKVLSYVVGPSLLSMRCLSCFLFGNIFSIFTMKIFQFTDHNKNNLTRSLNLALTPTIYFFFFLDYTDTASLALMSMAYYYCLVGSAWRMGIVSLLAVYIRQNNIIWCGYLLLYRIIEMYAGVVVGIRGSVVRSVVGFGRLIFVNLKDIFVRNYVQIAIFPLFVLYLYYYNNGRLVFGDHQNHQASFHPTQFLYLSLFIYINLPLTVSDFVYLAKQTLNRLYFSNHALAAYLFLVSGCIILVDQWTIVHPFILADNRHYIFYMYRYFKWAKFPLCLVYPFFIINIIRAIVNSSQKLVKFILWACFSMLYLMLSPLIQVRYFTIPFVMLAFQIRNRNLSFDIQKFHKREVKEERWVNRMIFPTLFKIAVNLFVFYMFLFRKFGENGQDRFIW